MEVLHAAECERMADAADEISTALELLEESDTLYDAGPEILEEAFSSAADSLRVYPNAEDGEATVDTCYLVGDLQAVIRRMEMIQNGAWMSPRLGVMISPDELIGEARRLLALARVLAKG